MKEEKDKLRIITTPWYFPPASSVSHEALTTITVECIAWHIEWISVKDKLPPKNTPVLLWIRHCSNEKVIVGQWEGVEYGEGYDPQGYREHWAHDTDCMDADVFIGEETEVLHWMNLPDKPEGTE